MRNRVFPPPTPIQTLSVFKAKFNFHLLQEAFPASSIPSHCFFLVTLQSLFSALLLGCVLACLFLN